MTEAEEKNCQQVCKQLLDAVTDDEELHLFREQHVKYLHSGLGHLSPGFICLDASRTWIIYWIFQSLDLLDEIPTSLIPRAIDTIRRCQNPTGGFGGGPQQISHSATTYASVLALLIIGSEEAYEVINRNTLYQWILTLKDPQSGGFRMHEDGEIDVRASYTVLSIAKLLNMLTPELIEGTADYILRCQSFEGGFGGEPGNEAHGGYSFCAFAALYILGKVDQCDVIGFEKWLAFRQVKIEGGFQGRINKLVDGCYSFWQAGAGALVDYFWHGIDLLDTSQFLQNFMDVKGKNQKPSAEGSLDEQFDEIVESSNIRTVIQCHDYSGQMFVNQYTLQKYILVCCQNHDGGLRDKPGKPRDFYHSCYCLSGLSVSQHTLSSKSPIVLGNLNNLVRSTHPVFNIRWEKAHQALMYFSSKCSSHFDLI